MMMREVVESCWTCGRVMMRDDETCTTSAASLSGDQLRVLCVLRPLLYSKHTWYNSDSLQGSEDSKCPESGKVA